ncbi:hypothetical protein QJS10_CPA05g02354 [Acorus calamus]|uniref:Uncharacterized protein n=1 Tax=Acorus calamus TaxID=4465 RepID=A0AAV9EXI0_ACOCL|nr:hypothetical protein QJS10_CPA05g02354 [Acorus calamus]
MASSISHSRAIQSGSFCLEDVHLDTNWEDVLCPICLDFPHNGVLLQCSSFEKGCRPFMCDTDHTHSNCLDRFKSAYGLPSSTKSSFTTSDGTPKNHPACPLCRGEVTGWVVIDEARFHLNMKKRCCEEKHCGYIGNYSELQKHAKLKHPHARPSEIDPARQLDWENFQQSSEIIDVLSTIHSEVPHGVVLGDYVIEYGDAETGDEFEDFPGDEGRWWTSCILYHVFDNFRSSRNRRRARVSEGRRGNRQSRYVVSPPDEGSTTISMDVEYRFDETDDEFVSSATTSREGSSHRSSRRRRSRFHDR